LNRDIFDVVQEFRTSGKPFAVATVVETTGSVSAQAASKAVIDDSGRVVTGWIGGGCAESTTCHAALQCLDSGQTTVVDIDLQDEVLGAGMPCGGHMRIFVEPVLPKPVLWIMGRGRVAECLCSMGDMLGLEIVVVDALATREAYPGASRLVTDDVDYSSLKPRACDFVVVATQHKGDHFSIRRALATDVQYIALIASRKRSRLVLDYLRQDGLAQAQLDRVMAPCGLDLGARTPEEIALCVMSEIVLVRRGGSGLRMRDKPRSDHEKATLRVADG
jgi:xanthine dehydrogenase accessory factor